MFRKITYTDKEDVLGLVSIDNKNKVTAQDMNDIKDAINDNTQELDRIMVHVAGDTMTGALNFKANTWNKYGSNVAVGAINTAGTLAVKGLDGKTTIRLVPNGATDNNGVTWTANSATDSTISGTLNGSFKGPLEGNAATTTKLQTARTINGTSFDGTTNIITNAWGTARDITLGLTKKSVNGSTNMAWTLAEMGALPAAGGTMTGSLIVEKPVTFKDTLTVNGVTDFNNVLNVTGATALKSTLDVTGATTLKNTLGVTGATTLGSTLSVTGIATLKNDTNINGALSVDKATTLKNTLNVTGITTLKNNAIINGTLSVDGATSLKSTLGVTGATTLGSTLDVTGVSTFTGNSIFKNNATVNGVLTVGGVTNLNNVLNVTGATALKSTLDVTGATTLGSTLSVTGDTVLKSNATVKGDLTVEGATTFNDELNITGDTTIDGALNITGATILGSTLDVTGIATFKNNTNINGTLSVDKATTLKNTLNVTGATTLGSTLSVTGIATLKNDTNINGALSVDKATTLKNTLGVTGATTLSNTLTVSGITNLNNALNVTGATALKSTLGVTGVATFNDNSSFKKNINIDGVLNSSLTTGTHLQGNQGKAIINSTATAGSYTMLAKMNSTNGYFTTGTYNSGYLLQYTAKSTVDAGTDAVTKSVTLLDESGNATFPERVTAKEFYGTFIGNSSTVTKLQTARKINDTSFDGTADITTTKWGTARNIYIADSDATNTGTAVSVNGSGNATLKLPATIKATLTGNASTATKLATARTIALTGSVTGSGTFDGSGNLSIATTTNHTHSYAGSSSAGGAANSAVKLATARNIAISGAVTGNANFDGSGNITISTSVNHSHNYAGSSSAGGAANSANWVNMNSSLTYGASGLQYFNQNTSTTSGAKANANPTNDWYHIIRMNHANSAGYFVDIAAAFHQTALYYRRVANGAETGWTRILDAENYNNYAPTKTGGGASGSWGISVTGSSASCTGNSATATTLATARTINGTSFNGSANITTANWGTARNISIADSDATNTGAAVSVNGSGNATLKLPATIKASLTGNASTATKLATARTISLTGSVTGSGTFDGSGNLSIATTTNHTHAYLPTAGGSMTGNINFNGRGNNYIGAGPRDGAGGVGEELNNLVISAWYGVSFTTLCDGDYKNKNAVSINTRTGHVYAATYHGDLSGNASTTTTLQNSRKINGTSFNGSADITTDKWGTARNISISDSTGANTGTAVSVNGGTNATLKLPSTIVATLSGNASSASALQDYNSASNTIQIGYSGNSLTSSEVAYLAAYKSGGKQIKDVSVSTVKTLMGIKNSTLNVTCSSSNWSGSAAPYTNTISVTGVTASNIVEVGLNNASSTDAQVQACMKASIAKITQENGKIKLYAYGKKPTVDIPMTVAILTT